MGKQLRNFTVAALWILFGNFVIGGPLDNWQFRSTNTFNCLRSFGDGFMGVGANGSVMSSADGITWSSQTVGTNNLHDVAIGTISETVIYPRIYYTPDLWDEAETNIFKGNGMLVAGDGGVTGVRSGVPPPTTNNLESVVYGNGIFLVSTRTRSITEPNFYIYKATNVFTYDSTNNQFTPNPWEPVVLGLPEINTGQGLPPLRYFKLCYANGIFVAAGASLDNIWTSTDGRNWTQRSARNHDYFGLAYGNGIFVTTGAGSPIQISSNGIDWTETYGATNGIGTTVITGELAFGNGLFIASGIGNNVLVSSNGIDWSQKIVTTNAATQLTAAAFGNGTFVVSGYNGASGTWQSDHFKVSSVSNVAQATNGVAIDLAVETGVPYTVQVSTNLQDWSDFVSFTSTNSNSKRVVDTNAATAQRFYRTVAP